MNPHQTLGADDGLVHARVVLHGARAQRIQAQIDRIVPGREPSKMAEHVYFADFHEARNFLAHVRRPKYLGRIYRGHIQLGKLITQLSGRAPLKQERLILRWMRTDFLDHAYAPNASATASMSARLAISVQHRSTLLFSSG